jgi:hypothetical protein
MTLQDVLHTSRHRRSAAPSWSKPACSSSQVDTGANHSSSDNTTRGSSNSSEPREAIHLRQAVELGNASHRNDKPARHFWRLVNDCIDGYHNWIVSDRSVSKLNFGLPHCFTRISLNASWV